MILIYLKCQIMTELHYVCMDIKISERFLLCYRSRFETFYFFPLMRNYFKMKTSLLLTFIPCKY